ncbi:ASKHA domain-containing protein [Desulfovibrio sp. X2]|uniref:ASKHA domain-containing protein n=1 Tax=Desulfovibrio sp. X2 TaxID=941449 RepID=UPI001F463DA9|nr:ASKHA domain-containing protein [Desulfovibrio sp. X2]
MDPGHGLTVAQLMFLYDGGPVKPLCGGVGRCGRCRTRFLAGLPAADATEERLLSAEELADGIRLACRHQAVPGMAVESWPRAGGAAALLPETKAAALAVDLGTTSIHWAALDEQGRVLAEASEPNPQLGAGSEIMSRLAFAMSGHADHLRRLVVERLRTLHRAAGSPDRLVVAANPSMTCLFLGRSVEGLSCAPYRLEYAGGQKELLAEDLPECVIPPQLGPFVGGDVSAGILHLEAEVAPPAPWLLADFGTNGEFALALPGGRLLLASVPMGPALEGVGLSGGCLAGPGAAAGFGLGPRGLTPEVLPTAEGPWEGARLRGMTGTGALSLLAQLRRAGALDARGHFVSGTSPLAARLLAGLREEHGEAVLGLPGHLAMRASDVEEVLKVKAACNAAVSALLAEAGLAPGDVSTLYLAGALGSHVRPEDLAELGFIPASLAAKAVAAGNTSLAGARLLAVNDEALASAALLPGRSHVLDMAAEADFGRRYIERMHFDYVP